MLIDDVIAARTRGALYWLGGDYYADPADRDLLRDLVDLIPMAIVFRIDAAAAYVDSRYHGGSPVALDDFPTLAPLAPVSWFEWEDTIGHTDVSTWGMLVLSDEGHYEKGIGSLNAIVITRCRNDPVPGFWPLVFCLRRGLSTGKHLLSVKSLVPEWEQFRDDGAHLLYYPLAAINFAHCKNVRVVDHHQPRQQVRAAERAGRHLVTYKTLVIDPSHAVVKHEQDRIKRGEVQPKSLHLVRGHFAEYGGTSGNGKLFGRYEGRYFIPMHTRGTLQAGAVVKDYDVRAPRGVS